MRQGCKKIAAAAFAAICAATLSGCADTGYIMTVDGYEIRNGVYLSCLMSSIDNANTEVSDARAEEGNTSEVEDVFVETIDGKSASDWIKEDAFNGVRRFVAIRRLCEQYGITLDEEEAGLIHDEINDFWNEENMYAQYLYGVDTLGEHYEQVGVSKESLEEVQTVNQLGDKLIEKYYGEGGTEPLSAEDFNAYLKDNYAAVKYVEIEYVNYEGLMLDKEEDIQAVKDKAQSYADRINSGESFADIKYEIDLQKAKDEAQVAAEDAIEASPADYPDPEAYKLEQINAATAEKAEDADSLDVIITKETSSLDENLTEYIWNAPDDGSATIMEGPFSSFLVIREDMTTREKWLSENRTAVLKEIKSDDFEELLKQTYSGYSVEKNNYLVDKKYAPDKIKT